MCVSRAKFAICLLVSMVASMSHGDLVIPSSFMTLDPYAEAQHHHEAVMTTRHYKPQVLPQVSYNPPLTYNVVPATPYDLLHESQQQKPHHQPHHKEPHYQPHHKEPHHHQQYDHHHKPQYKPPHHQLPLIPPIAHDKHFLSHNAHTQHFTYNPPKIHKHIKKTPLDFPKKGYISHKLTPARDDYARSLYFPVSGYDIDSYFYGFPAFGYFNYEPKLHAVDHHRHRRMLNFKEDVEDSEIQHNTYLIANSKDHLKDSTHTQQRIARSSSNDIPSNQKLQDIGERPSVITLLHRVPRTSAIFPKPPEPPRLLEPRSTHDQENTWLNQ